LKPYRLLLTGFLLITLFMPLFLAEPCNAAFIISNNITLERDGMIWVYQEQITGNEAIFLRNFIDLQTGNNDKFVNAWEIQKAETFFRNQTKDALKTKPDVKFNGTSNPVKVIDVDFWLSKEALGRTDKNSSITNSASVSYIFEKEVHQGTEIWVMGTPNSGVTITLPVDLDVKRTEGLDNKSQESGNNRTVLKGSFSPEKNITLWISENESFKFDIQELQGGEGSNEQGVGNKSKKEGNKTVAAGENAEPRKPSGSFKDIFTQLYLSPKS
jgi:hypothetical protein